MKIVIGFYKPRPIIFGIVPSPAKAGEETMLVPIFVEEIIVKTPPVFLAM
jgi:hypothetical protein